MATTTIQRRGYRSALLTAAVAFLALSTFSTPANAAPHGGGGGGHPGGHIGGGRSMGGGGGHAGGGFRGGGSQGHSGWGGDFIRKIR